MYYHITVQPKINIWIWFTVIIINLINTIMATFRASTMQARAAGMSAPQNSSLHNNQWANQTVSQDEKTKKKTKPYPRLFCPGRAAGNRSFRWIAAALRGRPHSASWDTWARAQPEASALQNVCNNPEITVFFLHTLCFDRYFQKWINK